MDRSRWWLSFGAVSLALVLIVGSAGCGPEAPADEPEAVVRALYFWSDTCPFCHMVLDEVFPPLEEKYGDQLEIATLELSEVPENYEVWLAVMEAFEVPRDQSFVPMLFVGDVVLIGAQEIPERFPELIEEYLEAGGVDYPDVPGVEDVVG